MWIQSKTLRNELHCIGGTTQQIQWALIIPNPRNTTQLIVMKRSYGEQGYLVGLASLPHVCKIYLWLERPWKATNRDARSAETLMGYRLWAMCSPSRYNLWTGVRDLLMLRFWFILAQYSDGSVAILMLIRATPHRAQFLAKVHC